MQQNICPTCNVELEWTGQYHCAQCESDFKKVGFCPDCEAELEKLQACGLATWLSVNHRQRVLVLKTMLTIADNSPRRSRCC